MTVQDVLSRATITGCALTLPPAQLDRKTYTAVNDVLERLGGKWNKKARAHLFPVDPSASLAAFLATGEKPAKNPDAFFPTPRPVVALLLDLADEMYDGGCDSPHILEPSAGTGAIALAAQRRYPACNVHCVEMNEARARALSDAGAAHVWCADFLEWETPLEAGYCVVAMNPPFAVERDACEWMAHVRRAHEMLAPNGVLVAIIPAGYRFRDDRKHAGFREWAERHGAVVRDLPPNAFKESGTGVSSLLLGLRAEPSHVV